MPLVIILGIAVAAFILLIYPLLGGGYPGKENRISLLLLVQNLEECIEGILREILWWGFFKGYRMEVVVIDRGSTDNTRAILRRFAYLYPACTIILPPEGRLDWDAGEAVRDPGSRILLWDLTGMRYCKAKELRHYFSQLLDKNISSASRESGG
ncbi:glycosyltransferase [Moorellaceae bacterium AZ2]